MSEWTLIQGGEPIMWGKKGVVSWNNATYRMMGDPTAIELLYDVAGQRLGFRGVYYNGAIRVQHSDDLRYTIDATEYIDNLGLILPNNWTATPHGPLPISQAEPGIKHLAGIVWIDIPTE